MNTLSITQMESVVGGKASTMCGLSLFLLGVSLVGLIGATVAIPPMSAVVFASAGEAISFATAFIGAGGSAGSALWECL